jgi:uncharacterized membrane protein YhaH (DUF805 family)
MYHETMFAAVTHETVKRSNTIGMLVIIILVLLALLVLDVVIEIVRMHDRPKDRR